MSDIQVMLLADKDAQEYPAIIDATAALLSAAKHGHLATVICAHSESGEEAAMLCSIYENPTDSTAQYVPLAMLFTPGNTPWVDYDPPASAVSVPEKGPLDVFEERDDGKDGS